MLELLKMIEKLFLNMDMFGHKVDLYINSSTTVKSRFGSIISLAILGICLYSFTQNYLSWFNNQNLQTISSSQSFSVSELLLTNKSFSYSLDYKNYNLYFSVSGTYDNGKTIPNSEIRRFVQESSDYYGRYDDIENLTLENCSDVKKAAFLFQNNEEIQMESKLNYANTTCLAFEKEVVMGVFANQSEKMTSTPLISYKISKCQNSSKFNNCASLEEINKIIPNLRVQISLPKTIYDFKKASDPRKRTYEYSFYGLDLRVLKMFSAKLLPIYLYTDIGVIFDDYSPNSIDFNVETVNYDTFIQDVNTTVLFEYFIGFGLNQQIYYRKNDKINVILANLGGFLNLLLVFGKLICYSYNQMVLKHNLINISFSNLDGKLKKGQKRLTGSVDEFKFSLFSFFCPKLSGQKVYHQALKNFYEYMDIVNIIKRLQDIDKLKMVLLNEDQRRVFEILPKPGIGTRSSSFVRNSVLTVESIMKSRKSRCKKETFNKFTFLLNGDPLNKRMLNLIDPNFKVELQNLHKEQHKAKRMISPHRVGFKKNSIINSNSENISQSEIEIPEENNSLPVDERLKDYY